MLKGFYYFEGTSKSLDAIKVEFGKSLISEEICTVGSLYDLEEKDGCVQIFKDGKFVGKTGKLVRPMETHISEPENMPFHRNIGGEDYSAQVMIVYTTERSQYAFIPANTLIEKTKAS